MKGWILMENGKFVFTSNNSIEVFRTKNDLFDYYGGSLGDYNNVKRVEVNIKIKFVKNVENKTSEKKTNHLCWMNIFALY